MAKAPKGSSRARGKRIKRAGAGGEASPRPPALLPAAPPDEPVGDPPPFLVAALGASAGGLEAVSALLRAIPADAILSLIVVQHLARDQPSLLPELLGNATRLTVVPAADGQKIAPRFVYVIPPDTRMTVIDGHLRLRPAAPLREAEGTVDLLFRSMAAEYRDRGVAVVLSGSAHDGAAGIREIKATGGITIAQQPEEAGVDGMPRSAIATGAVDAVLPVEEIAHHLARLSKHALFTRHEAAEPTHPGEAAQLGRAFQLLRRVNGVDFSTYKVATLRRRIERRMAFHRIGDLPEYVKVLDRDPVELARLQDELLIHVTSFFREPDSYVTLKETVFPRLFTGRDSELPMRFWVPGCSTGEEVYSLAMVALEFQGDASPTVPLQIFGTDISEVTVEKARAGVYAADAAAEVSPERLRRFFTRFDGGYRINKEVRDRCVFARQDVTRDPPFSKLDLIVCRNLLIYLNQVTQRKVLGVFHYALRAEGVLMLGRSETIGGQADLFSVIDKRFQLYGKKKLGGGRPDMSFPGVPLPQITPPALRFHARRQNLQPGQWDPQSDANRVLLDRYAPAAVIVDADQRILRARGSTGPFLELPSGEVSVDILKMARPEILPVLRTLFQQVRDEGRAVSKPGVRVRIDGKIRPVNVEVVPVGHGDGRQFLVLFDLQGRSGGGRAPEIRSTASGRGQGSKAAMEQELLETRHQLQSIIDDQGASNEELQSANEEILSSNEELQSTNEELDTAKEEMQSTNEELSTLNDELHARNDELTGVNSDLLNLLGSVQIPIVMVTRDLRIRRFTPAGEKIMNIIPSDVGRPIGHLKPNFVCPDLEQLIAEVIDTVSIQERQVRGNSGRLFTLQIRPYTSIDNRIDGAVVVMFDVSSAEDQSLALDVALEAARSAGATAVSGRRDPVLLLDGELKVLKANRAFKELIGQDGPLLEGRFIYEIGDGRWSAPALRNLLERVLPDKANVDGFVLDDPRSKDGQGKVMIDARRIEAGRRKEGVIILAVRDPTDHES